jgi:hypothetical protein
MVKVIFYVVVAVLVLSFFGVSLQHLIEAPTTQSNFGYVWSLVEEGWDDIVSIVTGLWNGIWDLIF